MIPFESSIANLILAVFVLVFVVKVFIVWFSRPDNFPPGPRGIPFLGIALNLDNKLLGEEFQKLSKKHGPVVAARVGGEEWILLNDYDVIHEALVKQSEMFSGRPTNNKFFQEFTQGKGVAMSDYGKDWKELRKFGVMNLKGFGSGKIDIERKIIEEMQYLTQEIISKKEEEFNPRQLLSNAVSNITSSILFGDRFEYKDEKFKKLIAVFDTITNVSSQGYAQLISFAYWTRHLPYVRGFYHKLKREFDVLMGFFQDEIERHENSFDENCCRDFIDAFLKEMKNENAPTALTKDQLAHYIRDFFEAGTDTTSRALQWCLLALVHFPEYQKRIHDEVTNVLGSAEPVSRDKYDMAFTSAFIHEITRHRTLLPISVFHKTSQDVKFMGYNIPKDTTVIPNLWAVHNDHKLFPNPMQFRPERFLDQDNNFKKSLHVIPFSTGIRRCLGQNLAELIIFLFLVKLVQNFEILPPKSDQLPSFFDEVKSIICPPLPYQLRFKQRTE